MSWSLQTLVPSQELISGFEIFATEKEAQTQAVIYIIDEAEGWDLESESEAYQCAVDINDAIASGNYAQVISLYNDYQLWVQDNYGHEDIGYYSIEEINEQKVSRMVTLIDLPVIEDEEEYEEDTEEPESFVATAVGATCRGACGNHYPDAYADRSDGTIECYQCRTFKKMFDPS